MNAALLCYTWLIFEVRKAYLFSLKFLKEAFAKIRILAKECNKKTPVQCPPPRYVLNIIEIISNNRRRI